MDTPETARIAGVPLYGAIQGFLDCLYGTVEIFKAKGAPQRCCYAYDGTGRCGFTAAEAPTRCPNYGARRQRPRKSR
jgi:hypothetical protein